MSASEWTDEEREWAMCYGLCATCGAPRRARLMQHPDGSATLNGVCSRDETHETW